jgi:cobalt-precorrin-5B (C1)-methyltransferase
MKKLRSGYTTGSCAAAAAKAAAIVLSGRESPEKVEIPLPDGERVAFPIVFAERLGNDRARAAVRKFAGDDPDVTDGALIIAEIERGTGEGISFRAGDGVGVVTRPGLSVPPGEPAINPAPREMIRRALREVAAEGFAVTVSVPGGRELAGKTYNPRLGIEGGLSILGTSGRVVPYSCDALREALKCTLDVALASGIATPVFVPGNIGRKAAEANLSMPPERIIEVGNEWGYMLDLVAGSGIERLLVLGHPGKLAKLVLGHWNTHSKKSPPAAPYVRELAAAVTGRTIPESVTAEGVFAALSPRERAAVSGELAARIGAAVSRRTGGRVEIAVLLINMEREMMGSWGDLSSFRLSDFGSVAREDSPRAP